MNWKRYKEIDREVDEICRAGPVTVTVAFDEFVELKRAVLLLRRIIGPDGDPDLGFVEEQAAGIAAKIHGQFAADPQVQALRAEQMEMLAESR